MIVRAAHQADRERWAELYRGYADFYDRTLDDDHLDRVWQRITGDGSVECYLAELDGRVVALAHVSEIVRPLDGGTGGYLHDLYVERGHRGAGVGAAVLTHLRGLAADRGWGVLRWITAADNTTAQRLYDQHAQRTTWVTYDLRP